MVTLEELVHWKNVTVEDMSEESDDPTNGNNLIVHNASFSGVRKVNASCCLCI